MNDSLLVFLVVMFVSVDAFRGFSTRSVSRSAALSCAQSEDPNFMAHLPTLLRKGLDERPDKDLGSELRKKYKFVETKKRAAAKDLKEMNPELAIELEVSKNEIARGRE